MCRKSGRLDTQSTLALMHATATLLALPDARKLEHRFEHCRVLIDVDSRTVTTSFEDSLALVACPNVDAESIARARSLRYGGSDEAAVWATTRDHDLLHTVMAEAHGHPWSATLHAVAHGYRLAPGVVEQEERLVLFARRPQNDGLEHIVRGSDDDPTRNQRSQVQPRQEGHDDAKAPHERVRGDYRFCRSPSRLGRLRRRYRGAAAVGSAASRPGRSAATAGRPCAPSNRRFRKPATLNARPGGAIIPLGEPGRLVGAAKDLARVRSINLQLR